MIASAFFSVYEMAIDTIFLCFCKYNVGYTLIDKVTTQQSNLLGCKMSDSLCSKHKFQIFKKLGVKFYELFL